VVGVSEDASTAHFFDAGTESFGEFYLRDFHALVGYLTVLGATSEEANDTAQDAMIQVYQRWADIDSPKAYARTVATRRLFRQRELGQRTAPIDPHDIAEALPVTAGADVGALHSVQLQTIKEALRKGYQQHQWDCILEITTGQNETIQGKV